MRVSILRFTALCLAIAGCASTGPRLAARCSGACVTMVEYDTHVQVLVTDASGAVVQSAESSRSGSRQFRSVAHYGIDSGLWSGDLPERGTRELNAKSVALPGGGSVVILTRDGYDVILAADPDRRIRQLRIHKHPA